MCKHQDRPLESSINERLTGSSVAADRDQGYVRISATYPVTVRFSLNLKFVSLRHGHFENCPPGAYFFANGALLQKQTMEDVL